MACWAVGGHENLVLARKYLVHDLDIDGLVVHHQQPGLGCNRRYRAAMVDRGSVMKTHANSNEVRDYARPFRRSAYRVCAYETRLLQMHDWEAAM